MDKELEAIGLIGRRRSRTRSIVFAITWPVMFAVLFFVVGIVINGIVSFLAAGAIAQGIMTSRTQAITEQVCRELDLDPMELQADKYLV
jgi:hypothetical protein